MKNFEDFEEYMEYLKLMLELEVDIKKYENKKNAVYEIMDQLDSLEDQVDHEPGYVSVEHMFNEIAKM